MRKDKGWCLHGLDDWTCCTDISFSYQALYICWVCQVYRVRREKQNSNWTHVLLIPFFLAGIPRCFCVLPGLGFTWGVMMVINTSTENGPERESKALNTSHSVSYHLGVCKPVCGIKGTCTLTLKSACTFWTSPDPNSTGFLNGACYPTPPCPGPHLYWWRNKMYSQVVAWILPCGAVCTFCPFRRKQGIWACWACLPPLPADVVGLWHYYDRRGAFPLPAGQQGHGMTSDKWGQAGQCLPPPDPAAPRWGGDVCSAVGDTRAPCSWKPCSTQEGSVVPGPKEKAVPCFSCSCSMWI